MVDTRSGKSTMPYSKAQQEQAAAILRERKKKKELLKQAKMKMIAEEQAAKKKMLEEEMKRLQQEEEEKMRAAVEEEVKGEKEQLEEEPLRRRRLGEGEGSSGTKEDDPWVEKRISEWVANLSLGEDEEAMLYIPQEEKEAAIREIEATSDPLERQAIENEKRLDWKLRLAREKKRRTEEANTIAREVESLQTCRQEVEAQPDVQAKLDKILGSIELPGGGGITETERHDGKLVVSEMRTESGLGLVLLSYADLVISTTKIDLREEMVASEVVKQIICAGHGIVVFDRIVVETAVVNTERKGVVLLAIEKDRGTPWGSTRFNEALTKQLLKLALEFLGFGNRKAIWGATLNAIVGLEIDLVLDIAHGRNTVVGDRWWENIATLAKESTNARRQGRKKGVKFLDERGDRLCRKVGRQGLTSLELADVIMGQDPNIKLIKINKVTGCGLGMLHVMTERVAESAELSTDDDDGDGKRERDRPGSDLHGLHGITRHCTGYEKPAIDDKDVVRWIEEEHRAVCQEDDSAAPRVNIEVLAMAFMDAAANKVMKMVPTIARLQEPRPTLPWVTDEARDIGSVLEAGRALLPVNSGAVAGEGCLSGLWSTCNRGNVRGLGEEGDWSRADKGEPADSDRDEQMMVVPMGWTNSVAVFQRAMVAVLGELIPNLAEVFLDDFPIKGPYEKDETEIRPGVRKFVATHAEDIKKVLVKLEDANLTVSGTKSRWAVSSIKILGYICDMDGRRPDPAKLEKLMNWPTPLRHITDIRQFLGVVGFWKNFIKGYAGKAEPLRRLLRKGVEWRWTSEQENTLRALKDEFKEGGQVLGVPYFEDEEKRPFVVCTDAGPASVGGVLAQKDQEGHERPLRFESKTLNTTERNYSQFKKEILGVLHCLNVFRHYIYGRRFVLRVDPMAVAAVLQKDFSLTDPTITRWLMHIRMFDYVVERISGAKNSVADGLSRIPLDDGNLGSPSGVDKFLQMEIGSLKVEPSAGRTPLFLENLYTGKYHQIGRYLMGEAEMDNKVRKETQQYCLRAGHLFKRPPKNGMPMRVVCDEDEQRDIIAELHDDVVGGHRGVKGTFKKVRNLYWWDGLYRDVESYCLTCVECQKRVVVKYKEPLFPSYPTAVGQKVHVDLVTMPKGEGGMNYIIDIRDDLTGFVEAWPLRKKTGKAVSGYLTEYITREAQWRWSRHHHHLLQHVRSCRFHLSTSCTNLGTDDVKCQGSSKWGACRLRGSPSPEGRPGRQAWSFVGSGTQDVLQCSRGTFKVSVQQAEAKSAEEFSPSEDECKGVTETGRFSTSDEEYAERHAMNRILHDHLDNFVVVYLDDILIFSKSAEEHAQHVETVLSLLRQHKYKVNLEKCEFGHTKILYLGHEVSTEGIRAEDAKVASIRDWPRPRTVTEVRSFLGMCGYYRNFVKNYSTVASPLIDLARLDMPWDRSDECEGAFKRLKHALMNHEVLMVPDPQKPFIVTTDASQYGIGVVLAQQDGKKLRPIRYMRKKMSSKKLAKSTYERELYALYKALVHWRHFVLGRFFYLRTDHQTLKWIKTQPTLSDALKRWIEVIDQYDFKLEYLKGEYNKVADALSRRADYLGALVSDFGVSEEVTQSLVGAYQEDPLTMDIMRKLQAKDKATKRQSVSMDFMDTLVTSKSGKRHIFVIIYRFTKYARLVAMLETARTDYVIKLFKDNWVRDFGLPKSIVSDRDVRFTSELWKKTSEQMGSQLQMNFGNYPGANGQAEQMNRVVQHLLRHYIKPSQDDWDEQLPLIASLYNNAVHSSTGVSPNQLHLGWKPRSALDFLLPEKRPAATPGTLEYGVQYEKLLEEAVEHMKKTPQAMIAYENQHRRQSTFQIGESVWVKPAAPTDTSSGTHLLQLPSRLPLAFSTLLASSAVAATSPSSLEHTAGSQSEEEGD
ncbi:hypothetical protein CBR_g11942 [Chara braunii]|uniref:Integrase catalytic domain-containing protein n=1 Tax=Chara braunii TaxID=69332 RepID=A0A388KQN0_CHABU|nr:hypothetical protein CBR_g11942 [Chara braunii]|eukprot:GBG72364.1 hypothetical protein CBR_g11942 [Chara braunii]